jgi:hypothetical protein
MTVWKNRREEKDVKFTKMVPAKSDDRRRGNTGEGRRRRGRRGGRRRRHTRRT